MKKYTWSVVIQILLTCVVMPMPSTLRGQAIDLRVISISPAQEVTVSWSGHRVVVEKGQQAGPWTLMAVVPTGTGNQRHYAVFEDFAHQQGHLVFVDMGGVELDFPKSLEPTFADPSRLYNGHTLEEVLRSDHDLLGDEILSKPGDPEYDEVAACFPPIRKMKTCAFVGTHETIDKVGFEYGGRSPDFDPAVYDPQIRKIREEGKVWNGLVGGWLPVVRFVYLHSGDDWTEMIAFAPLHVSNGNSRIQPVWYRVSRIEKGSLKWVRYFNSYQPFPPRLEYGADPFYKDLLVMYEGWKRVLGPGMKIEVPGHRLSDMAVHSLVLDMITRVGPFPKYGVFDKNYAGSEHDGFPDTFNVDTTAMLEWGLVDLAGQYIDNYFGEFVRDDGSILYRGPETGQYGRMLTVVAEYANYGGDTRVLLKQRRRIDGVTKLLLSMREKALKLPISDPAYGMIAGWSEADSCLDPDPALYMQPYFSNSTEAERGFRDLGRVWQRIGKQSGNAELVAWGQHLVRESEALHKDIQTAMTRSLLKDKDTGQVWLPAIAGVKEPFHVAVGRDPLDPQFRSYRAYMEMLYSGNLTHEDVENIVRYRAAHRDTILGIPTAYGYGTHELAGFLTYGHAYGLIQYDFVRKFLLTLYSIMAHQYTRGTWTAPETRNIAPDRVTAPYCTPAQLVVPMMTRWMLVFEDPQSDTLWLAKATPRNWLENGKRISVTGAPTRWGRVDFAVVSKLSQGEVKGQIQLPASFAATVKLRLRLPEGRRIQSVTVNGKPWTTFDPQEETVSLPAGLTGKITVDVDCR